MEGDLTEHPCAPSWIPVVGVGRALIFPEEDAAAGPSGTQQTLLAAL